MARGKGAVQRAYDRLPETVFDGVPVVGKPFGPEQIRDALLALSQQP